MSEFENSIDEPSQVSPIEGEEGNTQIFQSDESEEELSSLTPLLNPHPNPLPQGEGNNSTFSSTEPRLETKEELDEFTKLEPIEEPETEIPDWLK
jgi:hypothetical protein